MSVDQVGVIAARAADGSDEHYAAVGVGGVGQPAAYRGEVGATTQTRSPTGSATLDHQVLWARIRPVGGSPCPTTKPPPSTPPCSPTATALVAEYKNDHASDSAETAPPFPNTVDAFMRLVEAGWDTEVARRPHGQRTTVVVHVDVEQRVAALHLGPLLSDGDRQYLTCDATCEVWFERDGQPIGAGRTTRTINRRLRRALEHRHPTCAVPGCQRHPRTARPPHPALGRRRPHRTDQPRAALPVSPPGTPPRRHHHQRPRRPPHRHRQRRRTTHRGIASAPTQPSPTGCPTVSRTHRRTRPLAVVPTLRTTRHHQQTTRLAGCGPIIAALR